MASTREASSSRTTRSDVPGAPSSLRRLTDRVDGCGRCRSAAILPELGGAAVLLSGFAPGERLVKEPMLPLGLLRVRQFAGTQVAALGISASLFPIYLCATLYLQQVLGLSPLCGAGSRGGLRGSTRRPVLPN